MSIPQVACPECGAKLSSKAGFTAGQRIKCPKCQEAFAVPGAKRKPVVLEDEDEEDQPPVKKKKKPTVVEDEDEEDERPKKKKLAKKGAKERGYANSPLRFVILGVLVVVMLVMGYFLYRKLTAPPLPDIIIPARDDGANAQNNSSRTMGSGAADESLLRVVGAGRNGDPPFISVRVPEGMKADTLILARKLVGSYRLKLPPPGTQYRLKIGEDGSWVETVTVNGVTTEHHDHWYTREKINSNTVESLQVDVYAPGEFTPRIRGGTVDVVPGTSGELSVGKSLVSLAAPPQSKNDPSYRFLLVRE